MCTNQYHHLQRAAYECPMLGIKPPLYEDSSLLQGNILLKYSHFFRPAQEEGVPYSLTPISAPLFFGMFGEAERSGPTSALLSITVSKQTKHLQSCPLRNALSRGKYRWVFLLAHPCVRRAGAGLGPSSCLFGGA